MTCIECDKPLGEKESPRIIFYSLRHLSGDQMPEVCICKRCWYVKGFNARYQALGWLLNETFKPEPKTKKRRAHRIK